MDGYGYPPMVRLLTTELTTEDRMLPLLSPVLRTPLVRVAVSVLILFPSEMTVRRRRDLTECRVDVVTRVVLDLVCEWVLVTTRDVLVWVLLWTPVVLIWVVSSRVLHPVPVLLVLPPVRLVPVTPFRTPVVCLLKTVPNPGTKNPQKNIVMTIRTTSDYMTLQALGTNRLTLSVVRATKFLP